MGDSLTLDRRQFLGAGLAGSAWLAGGATLASLSGCSAPMTPAHGYLHLRSADLALLAPMAPVILAGAMGDPEQDTTRLLQRLDRMLDAVTPGTRDAMFQLYDVLQLGAFRWWVMDRWAHPATLSAAEIDAGLARWSRHQTSFARLAFNALCQSMTMSWYTDPDNARTTGYPGPPRKVNA